MEAVNGVVFTRQIEKTSDLIPVWRTPEMSDKLRVTLPLLTPVGRAGG